MLRNQQQEGLKTKNLLHSLTGNDYVIMDRKKKKKWLLSTQLAIAAGLLIYQLIQIKVYY